MARDHAGRSWVPSPCPHSYGRDVFVRSWYRHPCLVDRAALQPQPGVAGTDPQWGFTMWVDVPLFTGQRQSIDGAREHGLERGDRLHRRRRRVSWQGGGQPSPPTRDGSAHVGTGRGPVTITEVTRGTPDRAVCGVALLVRPSVEHTLLPGPRIMLALLAPETRIAQELLHHHRGAGGVALLAADITARIQATGCLAHALDRPREPDAVMPRPADERLHRALAFLASAQGPRPIERAAAASGLRMIPCSAACGSRAASSGRCTRCKCLT